MATLTSFPTLNGHTTLEALELYKTSSLFSLKSLNISSISLLNSIGIQAVSDLLCYKPIQDALLLSGIITGDLNLGYDYDYLLDTPGLSLSDVLNSEPELK